MLDLKYSMMGHISDSFRIQSLCFSKVSKINGVGPKFAILSIVVGDR